MLGLQVFRAHAYELSSTPSPTNGSLQPAQVPGAIDPLCSSDILRHSSRCRHHERPATQSFDRHPGLGEPSDRFPKNISNPLRKTRPPRSLSCRTARNWRQILLLCFRLALKLAVRVGWGEDPGLGARDNLPLRRHTANHGNRSACCRAGRAGGRAGQPPTRLGRARRLVDRRRTRNCPRRPALRRLAVPARPLTNRPALNSERSSRRTAFPAGRNAGSPRLLEPLSRVANC
jgi:hypothetical protein